MTLEQIFLRLTDDADNGRFLFEKEKEAVKLEVGDDEVFVEKEENEYCLQFLKENSKHISVLL